MNKYHTIVNFTGSSKDVTDLDDFFKKLEYKVEVKTDMTRDEVFECLQDVRERYLIADADDYSSFFCVVMSHGDAVSCFINIIFFIL